ncbi:uncharacterized protein NPIL_559931 [Nephila pilipes]|uniref:Uncharacterized protein n=1 Tax=Nephila pilipes TaxID=299642 RepID=A0A8X6U1K2_NEPPI|nr:uncharacterized protein NPIL_559931 [Nephila pilipes]
MNSMITILLVAALCYTTVTAGPYLPYRYGLGGVSSYYYSGAPFARAVAPYAPAPVAPVAPVPAVPAAPAVLPAAADYYALAASTALSYPGNGCGLDRSLLNIQGNNSAVRKFEKTVF